MAALSYIPSFYFYKFANAVAAPYNSMAAYGNGLIDASGNVIGDPSAIDPFEYFVIKLKNIFDQLPPNVTKYKLGNILGIMQLFSEQVQHIGITKDQFNCLVEAHITNLTDGNVSYFELIEDMTAGGIGGAGTLGTPADAPNANKGNVSGYDPVMGQVQSRNAPMNMIGAVEMFGLPSDEFRMIKATKGFPKTPTGNYLKRFGHRNADKKIAIRDEETGEVHWLPAANKKSFVEEYGLEGLDILNETADMQVLDQDNDGDTDTQDVLIGLEHEENDVNNPHHVKKMAAGHLGNLERMKASNTGNASLRGTAAAHEVRTRMAMSAIGMYEADLDNSGSNSGVDQAYFKRISHPRYINKAINNSGPDFIPYAQRAKAPASSAWNFFGGESKYRPSGRVLIPTEPILSALPSGVDREIAQSTFEGGHGLSTIRPSGQSKKLFNILTQDPVKELMTSSAEAEISKGRVPHSLQVKGMYTPRLIHGTGIDDMARHFATHQSSHGNVGIRSLRPTKTPSKVQTEFGEIKFPQQMEYVLGRINPSQQREIVVDDRHLGFLRNKMLGTSPSEEHKADVDAIIGGWAGELEKGGFYKKNREINLRAPRISEVL